MSVASTKNAESLWRAADLARRYGAAGPGAFSRADRIRFGLASAGARAYLRVLAGTCRWIVEGHDDWREDLVLGRRNFIFLLWHNRMPAFVHYCASTHLINPHNPMYSIVSASKDGELLARPIREMGGWEIRGSSTRDAARALRDSVRVARDGASILTVGDGPRGPRYRLKPGPILVARDAGLPVVPVTWAGTRVLQFHRAWDQLMLPLPFSGVRFRFGQPITVAPDADARGIARARREIEGALADLTGWADSQTRVARQVPRPKPGEVLKRRPEIGLTGRHVED